MTNNVIKFEAFQNARANATAKASVERATALYILANAAATVQANATAAFLDVEAFAVENIIEMPDSHYDEVIRASSALSEALRLLVIAADSLERAGQGQEIGSGNARAMFKTNPDDHPDWSA